MAKSLYICYFGVQQPLVQTQVIPYLCELQKSGSEGVGEKRSGGEGEKAREGARERGRVPNLDISMSLLTFEPEKIGREEEEKIRSELKAKGIAWHWLRYHKRPSALATAYDVFRGALFIRRAIARDKIDILHGRVHIPTLMGAIARRFSRRRPKLLFDIRGFFPEEYTDAGIWPENGLLYRSAKRVERWLMKESDGFVVLTEKAREILFPDAVPQPDGGWLTSDAVSPPATAVGTDNAARPIEVIPCCVDLNRFETATAESRKEMRANLGVGERFVLAYVGAFGGWYLTEETADLFGVLKAQNPDAFALILTQSSPEMIEPLLRERGYAINDYLITRVPSTEIPKYLSAADAAVSFIKRCYSKQASSPTKNAEYLACGLPIIANAGIGDVDRLINRNSVGALIDGFADVDYRAALDSVESLGDIGNRCREVARAEFDLSNVGGVRYRRIYSRLLNGVVNT